jgi:hypothetical protein
MRRLGTQYVPDATLPRRAERWAGTARGEALATLPMPEVERALRKKIRERLKTGALPLTEPARTWGGQGRDRICAACKLPITREQMEYEVEFEAPTRAALKVEHMHLPCFAAWELERELIIRASHRVS